MIRQICAVILIILLFTALALAQDNPVLKIKDIAQLDGIRDNHLIGYGLVVGLDGSGDSLRSESTIRSIANMLENFGLTVDPYDIRVRNVASVMVTADLPPFKASGDRIDANVASLGDARSLQGGVLLMTPLQGGDGNIYAVAQGPLSVKSSTDRFAQTSGQNVAIVVNGALVEREVEYNWSENNQIVLRIRDSSFSNANAVAQVINEYIPPEQGQSEVAQGIDPGRVLVEIPTYAQGNLLDFVDTIFNLDVTVEMPAKIVINERTGTVVIGHRVRISPVAVAHEGLSVRVNFSPSSEIEDQLFTQDQSIMMMQGSVTVLELVDSLNYIGASAQDIIAILQAIKRAGALHAELEVM